jgi:hypothetical protein
VASDTLAGNPELTLEQNRNIIKEQKTGETQNSVWTECFVPSLVLKWTHEVQSNEATLCVASEVGTQVPNFSYVGLFIIWDFGFESINKDLRGGPILSCKSIVQWSSFTVAFGTVTGAQKGDFRRASFIFGGRRSNATEQETPNQLKHLGAKAGAYSPSGSAKLKISKGFAQNWRSLSDVNLPQSQRVEGRRIRGK